MSDSSSFTILDSLYIRCIFLHFVPSVNFVTEICSQTCYNAGLTQKLTYENKKRAKYGSRCSACLKMSKVIAKFHQGFSQLVLT
mmetsp:Transcript_43703/g.50263  ORF Transcript_43703/g.50263 Transcript_43703/m.50263 type:complete len:84 (+) Transcript_43703:323-574(+)